MSLTENSGEYIAAAGKATPPLAVSGVVAAGLSLQDWVLIATLIYTALQIASLLWSIVRGKAGGG